MQRDTVCLRRCRRRKLRFANLHERRNLLVCLKQRTTVSVPKFDDPVTTSLQQPAPSIGTVMLQNSDKFHSIRKSQRERKSANFFVAVETQANKNDDSSEGIEDVRLTRCFCRNKSWALRTKTRHRKTPTFQTATGNLSKRESKLTFLQWVRRYSHYAEMILN